MKYTDDELKKIGKSEEVNRKIDKIVDKAKKNEKNWKRAHHTEDLIYHGESKLHEKLSPEQRQFHTFGVGMLKFEYSGQVTGNKGYIMLMMRGTAKAMAKDQGIRLVKPIIKSVKPDYASFDKTTIDGFYYLTVCRYLKIVSVR